MAEDIRWKQRFDNYTRALLTDLEQQGLIQAFEFTHELAWNVVKDSLEYEGIQGLIGSRGAVREAFKQGLIVNGEAWIDMIDKRNLSCHTYNLDIVHQLVRTIREVYYPEFVTLQELLEKQL